jgi:hypothetical protein
MKTIYKKTDLVKLGHIYHKIWGYISAKESALTNKNREKVL